MSDKFFFKISKLISYSICLPSIKEKKSKKEFLTEQY